MLARFTVRRPWLFVAFACVVSQTGCTHDFFGQLADGGAGSGTTTSTTTTSSGNPTTTGTTGAGGCAAHANAQLGPVAHCVMPTCGSNNSACCTEGMACDCTTSPPVKKCDYACSGTMCQAAQCVASNRECRVECDGCTLDLPAGGSDPVDVTCAAGAHCDNVTCSGDPCCLTCDGASSRCTFTCDAQSSSCSVGCTAGSSCNVKCNSPSCKVFCEAGSTCVVTGSALASAQLDCGNGQWQTDCKGTLTCAP